MAKGRVYRVFPSYATLETDTEAGVTVTIVGKNKDRILRFNKPVKLLELQEMEILRIAFILFGRIEICEICGKAFRKLAVSELRINQKFCGRSCFYEWTKRTGGTFGHGKHTDPTQTEDFSLQVDCIIGDTRFVHACYPNFDLFKVNISAFPNKVFVKGEGNKRFLYFEHPVKSLKMQRLEVLQFAFILLGRTGICEVCGTPFRKVRRKRVKQGLSRYCSRECWHKAQKTKPEVRGWWVRGIKAMNLACFHPERLKSLANIVDLDGEIKKLMEQKAIQKLNASTEIIYYKHSPKPIKETKEILAINIVELLRRLGKLRVVKIKHLDMPNMEEACVL